MANIANTFLDWSGDYPTAPGYYWFHYSVPNAQTLPKLAEIRRIILRTGESTEFRYCDGEEHRWESRPAGYYCPAFIPEWKEPNK